MVQQPEDMEIENDTITQEPVSSKLDTKTTTTRLKELGNVTKELVPLKIFC